MFGLTLLRRLPPALTTWLFYTALPFFLVIRYLLSTILGALFLSLFIYAVLWSIGDTRPFTFLQLVIWIDELPLEAKTSVFSSLITVAGFIFAFHTATINWKAQALATAKFSIATEFDDFFSELMRLGHSLERYAKALIKTSNEVRSGPFKPEFAYKVKRMLEEGLEFRVSRERLSQMSVDIHSLGNRHQTVLSSMWGATKSFDECATALSEVASKMWITVPFVVDAHPDPITCFLEQVDEARLANFAECCDQNVEFISGLSGGLRGLLLNSLVEPNLSTINSFSGKRAIFMEAITKVRKHKHGGV